MKNQYGYVVYYKQQGSEKMKIYLITDNYETAKWNVRWYESHSPPDRKTGEPLENVTWIIRPITTYREYRRRWRGCPFAPLLPKSQKL